MKTDVLIVGAGIAGLSLAIKLAEKRPDLKILVLSKSSCEQSNTSKAQGGMAVVLDQLNDSFEQHIEDTLTAGGGLCDKEVVEMVVRQAPERLRELISWGAEFDYKKNGLDLGLEGGHSQNRIVHHRDRTGFEIQKTLMRKSLDFKNLKITEDFFAVDLILKEDSCRGISVLERATGKIFAMAAKTVVLASGGSGSIFKHTTNPSVATGDGLAMAIRAGAKVNNLRFFQFHPTAFHKEQQEPLFLISEAVRGFGAYLINSKGKRFVFQYDSRGELATRDKVSAAIFSEIQEEKSKHVYLDCRHLEFADFRRHFPQIADYCLQHKIHPEKELIPVIPAAHYQCGGIDINRNGKTSIPGLFAAGECSNTGLHGSNRLASNSLLEALVYAHQIAEKISIMDLPFEPEKNLAPDTALNIGKASPEAASNYLRKNMNYKLIHSENLKHQEQILQEFNSFLKLLPMKNKQEIIELRNMITVACAILQDCITSNRNLQLESWSSN